MQLVKHCTPSATLECHNELEQFVGRSLIGDWMICIEHKGDGEPPYSRWQQWGDMLFAITRPDSVMEAIYACRDNHPTHAIRIYAEKVWPESRMIYRIHETPDGGHTNTQSTNDALPAPAANQGRGTSSTTHVRQSANAAWGTLGS